MTSETDGRSLGRRHAFFALCRARLRETYRESEVVFWSFVFPVALAVGLGLAFRSRGEETLPIAVVDNQGGARMRQTLAQVSRLDVRLMTAADAARALRVGAVAVVVEDAEGGVIYRMDPSRPESGLARDRVDDALQRAAGRKDAIDARIDEVREPGGRYIDFLIPGILGMNIMGGGMWGVGFNLVDMRIKKLLKRLLATPMRKTDFMLAQMSTRLAFTAIEVLFVLLFGHFAFGVPIRGAWSAILAIGALGAASFGGLGLLLAARPRRIEGVMGLMNLVQMPMYIASGIFFSVSRFPESVQPLIRLLPLTALLDAMRAVVLEGASLVSQGKPLTIVAIWGVVSFTVGLRLFRWS